MLVAVLQRLRTRRPENLPTKSGDLENLELIGDAAE
jgi:hypothetical protein